MGRQAGKQAVMHTNIYIDTGRQLWKQSLGQASSHIVRQAAIIVRQPAIIVRQAAIIVRQAAIYSQSNRQS